MKCLITGATGHIGCNLARVLVGENQVFATGGMENRLPPGCQWVGGPFQDLDWGAIPRLDVLFHLAANTDPGCRSRAAMIQANTLDAISLFQGAVNHGCESIVYASSAAVYGNQPTPFTELTPVRPLTPYAESKANLDHYADLLSATGVRVRGLRFCNVYGVTEGHKGRYASYLFQLCNQMLLGDPVLFEGTEGAARDWLYVKDAATALVRACSADSVVYNVGSGTVTCFGTLVEMLNCQMGLSRSVRFAKNPSPETYQYKNAMDIGKAVRELGFAPRQVEECLEEFCLDVKEGDNGRRI